jgi:hypothetical protein
VPAACSPGARAQLVQQDAAAGVVLSVPTIVRTLVPVALVRPEPPIEAAYIFADQGLAVSRRIAFTVSSQRPEPDRGGVIVGRRTASCRPADQAPQHVPRRRRVRDIGHTPDA